MPLRPFLLYTTLGAASWNSVLALIGYLLYRFTDLKTVDDVRMAATKYSHEIGYAILGIVVVALGYIVYKQVRSKK